MASGNLFSGESAPETTRLQGAATVHAHCDGGARGNPGPAGYGAVLVADDGSKLAELSEFLGIRTNNYAEYSGLLGVLAWTLENGHKSLRVVSDSELMVKQIQGRYKVNSPDLRPLFEEAKKRIARLDSFQISHALRHKNKDADRLANEAMDRGMNRVGSPPGPAKEQRATPYPTPAECAAVTKEGMETTHSVPVLNAAGSDSGTMLRGFVRDGVVHLLGGKTLRDGSFVKIIAE